jgi:MarR family 2-MHQ and catechol resistance regulon transcriptional repressor
MAREKRLTSLPVQDNISTSNYLTSKGFDMPTHFTGSRAERRALDTFIKLTRCTNSLFTRLAEHNTIGDLTYSQFAVLEALHHLGPLTQGEVSQKVLKSGSNMTTVIDNLERHGLVRRERDANDRRVIRVHLTEAGLSRIETVFPEHVAALVEEFSVLSASEQEMLGTLCRKLGTSNVQSSSKTNIKG